MGRKKSARRKRTGGRERPSTRRGRRGTSAAAAARPDSAAVHASDGFPIVGVGASAGGLEAFTQLLKRLPIDTGMAFVLVQHLDPKRESLLTEILSRATAMPVGEVKSRMAVAPDNVYVMPARADIELRDGSFELVPRSTSRGRQTPIDFFFRSLADQYKSRAIGVVLSGTLSDGALGLRAIKAEGGVTFAQDENSAKFPDMPRAAIAAGAVDFVFPPEGIATELARMGRHPYVRPSAPAPAAEEEPAGEKDHRQILALLRRVTGVDFSHYRQTTVKRRISRRMALKKADSPRNYLRLLRADQGEAHALYEDILINVTGFFRDPTAFDSLKELVFPAILKNRSADTPIRIWVPGSSTGEEVYSIAIALFESLQERGINPPIQIFATDLSQEAVNKARSGVYLENAVADVSRERLKRFFVKADNGWQISKAIRSICIFARQNVTTDPPFSNLDLISCRNLLIYLEPVLQKRVVPLFHYALKPGGFLFLGNAETITGFSDLFAPLDRNQRIFVKRPGVSRQFLGFGRSRAEAEPPVSDAGAPSTPESLQKEADRLVLGMYGPPGVLINEAFEILQFRGRTSPYLESAPGSPTLNVLKMAREGLMMDLRASVLKARKTGRPVRKEGLRVGQDGQTREVSLRVVPLKDEDSGGRHFLVFFEEAPGRRKAEKPRPPPRSRRAARRAGEETVVRLEQELSATREYLQSIIEEQEATNEELKSANEEILSSNEELQSTNEELETAKEELQSTNEELTTVNDELQNRNAELTRVNDDLQNILTGTNVPIVMLDRGGRIRRFTPSAERLLNLSAADAGRLIRDIKPNVRVPDLQEIVLEVIESVVMKEREIQDHEGHWHLLQVRPYRTLDNRIDGAVMVFLDIDPMKRSLEQVNRARDYAEALVETVRESLVVLDEGLRVRTANNSFYRVFQTSPIKTEGQPLLELWNWERQEPDLKLLLEKASRGGEALRDFEAELAVEGLGNKTLLFNARRVRFLGDVKPFVLLAIDDITERKVAENALRASEVRYRQIFEAALEGVLLQDAETGRILDANPYLLDLLGFDRSELIGRTPWDLGLYENAEEAKRRFRELLETGFSFDSQVLVKAKSGRILEVETVSNVQAAGTGRIVQRNIRDVSERNRLQQQLRQVQKLESIGTLAGGIAHDFNNLLNIISAHVGLLAKSAGEKGGDSVHAIQKSVERGAAVVRQLLAFARKSEVSFGPVDLNEVVRELSEMLRETFPRSVRLDLDLAPDLPLIRADANQLHQAILNLAVNARDAMPDGGELRIGTGVASGDELRERIPAAAAPRYVCLTVSDRGVGMDEETRKRLFEPFFTTRSGQGGQGLGLAVVYGIVNSHHGVVDVASAPGEGTTFKLCFPADEPVAERPGKIRKRSAGRARKKRLVAGATLLLVEDEEMLLQPVKGLLEEEGYEVLVARDGREAVEVFQDRASEISAVIIDLGLPKLNGLDALIQIKQIRPDVRCIVASGTLDSRRREEVQKAGASAALRKPYDADQMLNTIESVLAS